MKLITDGAFSGHVLEDHPEHPARLEDVLSTAGDTEIDYTKYEDLVGAVHFLAYTGLVRDLSKESEETGEAIPLNEDSDDGTKITEDTYRVACIAAGKAVEAAQSALNGENAFALVRPPGHHANATMGGGFCIFNNLAVAVHHFRDKGNILIFDFDLHHGNGTEEIFYGEEMVHYFSIHQSGLYPLTGSGFDDSRNITNIPLDIGTGDDEYIRTLDEHLVPLIKEFNPRLIAVSAGFDSYFKDSSEYLLRTNRSHLFRWFNNQGFNLTRKSYERIREIVEKFPTFYVLEGGYNPESVREGLEVFLN